VTTNQAGFYAAPFLAIGPYRVTARLAGFAPVVRGVDVGLNRTAVIDFSLGLSMSEKVTVFAERPPINLTNQEVKQSLTAEQIMDKPTLIGGNNAYSFLSLAETFAGFQENPTSGQNNPTASSGSSINFNGAGTRGATFQIDGVNNDDASENQNRQGVSLATIKEFQVISNSYSAEFGRGYGAVVLVQTKSGTNEVHGEAFYYRQDSHLNAKDFFAATKPNNQRDNFGAVLGFPILTDKLHGFVSYDWSHRTGFSTYVRDVFTAADLSAPRLTRGNDTPANRAFLDSVLARFPSSLSPNDPRSDRTYQGTQGFDQPLRDYSGRLDWAPTPNDQVVARYQYYRMTRWSHATSIRVRSSTTMTSSWARPRGRTIGR